MRNKLWTILGLYAVLALATLPLLLRWVPPNRWSGFRLPGAMIAPENWYQVNEVGARNFLVGLAVCVVINLLLLWKGTPEMHRHIGWINAALVLITFWLVSVQLVGNLPQ